MEILRSNRTSKWKKKGSQIPTSTPILPIFILSIVVSLTFFFSYRHISIGYRPSHSQCGSLPKTLSDERFLLYAPHSGFSNQLSEFKNAMLMASILNRTLIVPPILDHHAVALGSCPKFRVLNPNELRLSVWNHSIELLRSRRYISMGDIVDLRSLVSSSIVKMIDFRRFASTWCGVDLTSFCSEDSTLESKQFDAFRQCRSLLSGYSGNIENCLYAVDEDCRTTVWIYQKGEEDGSLDSFQPDEQLKKKKRIPYVRRRQDVYKALGPGSKAEPASVLAFGTLFSSVYKGSESYIDIHESPRDEKLQALIEKIKFLPFVPEITSAGKEFASTIIGSPFLCAQLRLLDGQFKNHWKSTFLGLKQKIEVLSHDNTPRPIHIFIMTDLPQANWTGTYLEELARNSDSFKLHVLKEEDELITKTAKKLADAGHGMKIGFSTPQRLDEMNNCSPASLSDILLYIEETVCSCASLGFTATAGSTIAESIDLMREHQPCSG
ncbi:O-fucosyltransferase 30 [Impatiens glandulifera]|uniref:O-fucosyltransferase 30 n=1 Tax=Impatiens glandulifera TaxID=253017 RepID=UPI001FB186A8|nr:O-fucosyltransferase 30 [Impatiens glandulifera]